MLMLSRTRAFQCAFIFGGTMHHHNQYKEQSTFLYYKMMLTKVKELRRHHKTKIFVSIHTYYVLWIVFSLVIISKTDIQQQIIQDEEWGNIFH